MRLVRESPTERERDPRMETTPRPPPPAALERIGRYRIVRPLSKGGMALVYEARRESLAGVSPRVAVKLILPEYTSSDTFQDLFINEARLGASMHHQNLVQIQDFDRDGERFFLVMEYVEGITLRRAISLCRRNRVHVPLGAIAEIGRQACDGLDYAHKAADESGQHLELVHRDVKPSNLILNPQGVLKLVDFGISKGRRLFEKKGTVKGTWGYMAPEQARGDDVGPGTDVFGLAVVLYEMASKRPLFPDKTPEVVKRLLADDHAARMAATLDPAYRPLIGPLVRALQRDPAARYPTASEFGRALSALLPDPISARDEVVKFYEGVRALHDGLPVPEGTLASDHSIAEAGVAVLPGGISPGAISPSDDESASSIGGAVRPPDPEALPVGWMIAAVLGGVLLLMLLVGAGLLAFLPREAEAPVEDPTVASALLGGGAMELGDRAAEASTSGADASAASSRTAPSPEGPGTVSTTAQAVAPRPPSGERPPPSTSISGVSEASSVLPGIEPGPEAAPTEARAAEEPERRVVVVRRAPEVEPEDAGAVVEPEAVPDGVGGAAPDATGPGYLTVGARQAAEVYIDGRYVRRVPLVRGELEPGDHVITIQALDGRKKTFDVRITAGEELRRVWDFDRGEWRP